MFIKAMHPKTEIKADAAAIRRILDQGWWGQMKIHGHRAQLHIGPHLSPKIIAYTRRGTIHRKKFPDFLKNELYRLFPPQDEWMAIDCEWHKPTDKLYLFDVLKWQGKVLRSMTYEERYNLLPQVYNSSSVETLPLLKTVKACLNVINKADGTFIEGLVFKSPSTAGFLNTSIIRCRA